MNNFMSEIAAQVPVAGILTRRAGFMLNRFDCKLGRSPVGCGRVIVG